MQGSLCTAAAAQHALSVPHLGNRQRDVSTSNRSNNRNSNTSNTSNNNSIILTLVIALSLQRDLRQGEQPDYLRNPHAAGGIPIYMYRSMFTIT